MIVGEIVGATTIFAGRIHITEKTLINFALLRETIMFLLD